MSYHLFNSHLSYDDYLREHGFSQNTNSTSQETGNRVSMKKFRQIHDNIQTIERKGNQMNNATERVSSVEESKEDNGMIKSDGIFCNEVTKEGKQTLTLKSIVQSIRDDLFQDGERIASIEFCHVLAGTFRMGRLGNFHRVTISRDFYLGKYPVTQEQWQAVMEANPSFFKGAERPVENISWNDCQQFIERLNHQTDKDIYRLPTEAEWEYACRAGSITAYSFGDNKKLLDDYGWYYANSVGKSHPVGKKAPNPWGFYDMHGHVWEWCKDWYAPHPRGLVSDPEGPSSGSDRVLRGGGWFDGATRCRSGFRSFFSPDFRSSFFGFRLARNVVSDAV